MNENDLVDDPRLLELAASISAGAGVDWQTARRDLTDPAQSATLDELQALEHLSRFNKPTPMRWGHFTIVRDLGVGAFGTVYEATDDTLQLPVALKVLRTAADAPPLDATRALNEARLLAQIKHPHVVRVHHAERRGDEVGVSMELVHGHTLDDLVGRDGPFSAGETLLIGQDLCSALAAVHAAGMVHGDVKARNVMREAGGRIVLMDFGAGRSLRATSEGEEIRVAGTPLYLAPELFDGRKPSQASDIYSLGVLLYFLATGAYPLDGRTFADLERQHRQRAPRRALRDARPDLPASFIQTVEQALPPKPVDRYRSAGDMEAAIRRAVHPQGDRRQWRPPILIAASLVATVALATLAYRMLFEPSEVPSAAPAAIAPAAGSQPPASSPNASYRIDAALSRLDGAREVRLQPGAQVAPGDRLSLEVQASVPTYVYVVNEDEQGQSFLLYPLPGQGLTNPLPPGRRHRLPGVQNGEQIYWQVTSPGGREHFLIFATPDPSPAFERMFASLPRPAAGTPVVSHPLSTDAVAVLRGVGGLTSAPARSDLGLRLTQQFATPLPDSEETARGVWVRQIALENPRR